MRRSHIAAACAAALSAVGAFGLLGRQDSAVAPPVGTEPSQWRVVWTESPQTRALIAWSTAEAGQRHVVYWDKTARGADLEGYTESRACETNGRYSGVEPRLHYHHVALDGLEPSTTYYFVMVSDGDASRELHFTTAPDDDREFAILSGGDSRSGHDTRREMNGRIRTISAADPKVLALAHGGDYVYSGSDLGMWSRWMSDNELVTTADGRVLPIIPARGNHEAAGQLFDEVFGWPGGGLGKNYFATRLSPEVLLITLNTETVAGGKQREFLARTLEENREVQWKVVQYHRPIWPGVKAPARTKAHWQPLFDEHGVDLVCESDGHVLKRTVRIRGDEEDENGVLYIGEGGLGVRQRTPKSDRWYLREPGVSAAVYHVWRVLFTPEAIDLRAIAIDGEIADTYTLK